MPHHLVHIRRQPQHPQTIQPLVQYRRWTIKAIEWLRSMINWLSVMTSWDAFMVALHLMDVFCIARLNYSLHQPSNAINIFTLMVVLPSCFVVSRLSADQHRVWGRTDWRAVLLYPIWPELVMAGARYKMRHLNSMLPPTFLRRLFTPSRQSVERVNLKSTRQQYWEDTRTAHSGMALWALCVTLPISGLNLIYCCGHPASITSPHMSALVVSITFLCCSVWHNTLLCFLHKPTMLFVGLLLSLDIVHLYTTVLLLGSSSPASSPHWYPSRVASLSLPLLFSLYASLHLILSFTQGIAPLRFISIYVLSLPVVSKGSWAVWVIFQALMQPIERGGLLYERLYGFIESGRDSEEQDVRKWWNSKRILCAFDDQYLPPCPSPYSSECERRAVVQQAVTAQYATKASPSSFHSPSLEPASLFAPHWLPLLKESAYEVWYHLRFGPRRCGGTPRVTQTSVLMAALVAACAAAVLCNFVLPATVAVKEAMTSTERDGTQQVAALLRAAHTVLLVLLVCLLPSVWRFYRTIKPLHMLLCDLTHMQHCKMLVSLSQSVHSTLIRPHLINVLVEDGMLREIAGIVADYCGGHPMEGNAEWQRRTLRNLQRIPVYECTAAFARAVMASSPVGFPSSSSHSSSTMSSLSASLASLTVSLPDDSTTTTTHTVDSITHPSKSATKQTVVTEFNTLIREIKQLKKQHPPCTTHHPSNHTTTTTTTTPAPAADNTCPCHHLLQKYQHALTLASTIHTASSAATRQQLIDRITQLSASLAPPIERIDSRYTVHRPPTTNPTQHYYALTIPHAPPTHYRMPAPLYHQLYDYQRESVHWLCQLHAQGEGGVLGDDMGLGKTVQISALLGVLFYSKLVHHVLLIVPTTLIDNWKAELTKWCPALPLHLYTDTPQKRAQRLAQCLHSGGILLSTYGVLSTLQHTPFDAVILDEGHRIKNYDTQQTRQVKALQCKYRILCTGTVIQNRLTELWCLMDFVCCGRLLGERREFKERWSDAIENGKHKGASVEAKRLSAALSRQLSALIRPYIMRRTKEEIKARQAKLRQHDAAATLPSSLMVSSVTPELRVQKNELVVWLYPSDAQRRLYTALLSSGSKVMKQAEDAFSLGKSPLSAMSLLRTLCSHPRLVRANHKLCVELPSNILVRQSIDAAEEAELIVAESEKVRLLLSLLDEHRRHGHRTLVFSWSVQMLDLVSTVLSRHSIQYLRIDGKVPPAKRTSIIEAFRQPNCPASVFLLTTGVGGVGLNLTSADRCVLLEPDWNPAIDAQSVDRCYRIGQQRNVVVYRFVTIGTVEEIAYRKQVFKQSLIRLVQQTDTTQHSRGVSVEGEEGGAQFTRDELRAMFKLREFNDSATQRQLAAAYPPHLRRSYRELDEHIESLQRQGIFGLTDHDLLNDDAVNANRPVHSPSQQSDDEGDPMERERDVAAAKRATHQANEMTKRLQQYVPQTPAWPSLSRRRGKGDNRGLDREEKEGAKDELDWRKGESRKEREEEKTAEWIDHDESGDEDNCDDDRYSGHDAWTYATADGKQQDAHEEEEDEEKHQHPSSPSHALWTKEDVADGGPQAEEESDDEEENETVTTNADGEAEHDYDHSVHADMQQPSHVYDGDTKDEQQEQSDNSVFCQHDDEGERQADEDQDNQRVQHPSVAQTDGQCESESEGEAEMSAQRDVHNSLEQLHAGDQSKEDVGGEVYGEEEQLLGHGEDSRHQHVNEHEAVEKDEEGSEDEEEEGDESKDENACHAPSAEMDDSGERSEDVEDGSDTYESTEEKDYSDDECDDYNENETAHVVNDATHHHDKSNDQDSEGGDEGNEYEVEAIVDKRSRGGHIEYKVRWKGYGADDDSWQTEVNLDCDELVQDFERGMRAVEDDGVDLITDRAAVDSQWAVDDEALEAHGGDDEEEEGEEEEEEDKQEYEESYGYIAVDAEASIDSDNEHSDKHDTATDTDQQTATASSNAHFVDLSAAPDVNSTEADDNVIEDENDVDELAGQMTHLNVTSWDVGQAEDNSDESEVEAVYEDADEHNDWNEAVEWAADTDTLPSTPAAAPSPGPVSATPVRLHVHASVAQLADDNEPHSYAQQQGDGTDSTGDTVRCRHLINSAVQLIHTALHMHQSSEWTCACCLHSLIQRLPHLTVDESEEALDLLTQAMHLSVDGCAGVMEVALVLMERLDETFDETKKPERAEQQRPPGAGVRRWLCV